MKRRISPDVLVRAAATGSRRGGWNLTSSSTNASKNTLLSGSSKRCGARIVMNGTAAWKGMSKRIIHPRRLSIAE